MLSFLSPDGEIGAPLQAAAFLITLFLAVFVSLCLVSGLASRHGLARCARALVRTPSLTIAALLALTALNLVHHAVMPLTGVFRPEVGDGGWVENLTILAMLILPAALVLRLARRRRSHVFGPICLGAASLLLLIAFGEEVSWGQHWFGLTPPPQIAQTNLQGEINLHNDITPDTMEMLYLAAAAVLFGFALAMPRLVRTAAGEDLLGLRVLILLCAVLMSHHIFQELAELAVIATGVILWSRLEAGQLELRPAWARSLARI